VDEVCVSVSECSVSVTRRLGAGRPVVVSRTWQVMGAEWRCEVAIVLAAETEVEADWEGGAVDGEEAEVVEWGVSWAAIAESRREGDEGGETATVGSVIKVALVLYI
jgi:hypothetical protein